jgi:leader peptidase (prepilin peptidase) / N-methyltransferase
MLVFLWLGLLLMTFFLIGSAVGSFLNVCIARLPAGQNLAYPGSRCGTCGTPIRLRDNIPLLSYWLLHGRCRACGTSFSMRYFWVELATGLGFVAVVVLEVGWDIHRFNSFGINGFWYLEMGRFPPSFWPFLITRLLMLCLLIVALACALERQRVPLPVLETGLILAVAAAVAFPWPWPHTVQEVVVAPEEVRNLDLSIDQDRVSGRLTPTIRFFPYARMVNGGSWSLAVACPRSGMQPWPVWGPLPSWLPPGTWQLGLITFLAGALAGAAMMILVHCGLHGRGQGDIVFLTLAGAFLGWQPVLTAGSFGTLLAALLAIPLMLCRGSVSAGLTCCLGLGVLAAWTGWPWLGPFLYLFFFDAGLLPWLLCALVVLPLLGFWLRWFQRPLASMGRGLAKPMSDEASPNSIAGEP